MSYIPSKKKEFYYNNKLTQLMRYVIPIPKGNKFKNFCTCILIIFKYLSYEILIYVLFVTVT